MLPIDPEGGWPLALARGLSVAALLSAFGALLFRGVVLPKLVGKVAPEEAARRVARLGMASLVVAVPLLLVWAGLQTSDLAQSGGDLRALAAGLPAAIGATSFGHVWLGQLATVVVGVAILRWKPGWALLPCTAAVILQAGHSHALSMYGGPSLLLLSDVVHLLAAGAWLGGLLPLLLAVQSLPSLGGALAARWFSPLGKACVIAMTITAVYQGWQLVGDVPGLVGTAYGEMAIGKLGLFGALFAFAFVNRYTLAPALLGSDPAAARRTLLRSIAVQTGFGVAIVVAAALLSNLPPALHEQPLWPFDRQFSLVTVEEDPEFKQIVMVALLELGLAALVLAVALSMRRFRVVAAAIVAAVTWWAAPDLRLLLVPAYPTSFYRSPTAFAASSITRGAMLYPSNCAACHGPGGHGDGPLAASLPVPPADLTASHLWAHLDGELFWWLARGIEAPDGQPAMPGFAEKLSPDDRWALIDYVRANNAGVAKRETGQWPVPVAAPALTATCADGTSVTLADLRGKAVRLIFVGGDQASTTVTDPNLTTLTIGPTGPGCTDSDPAVPAAYAIALGTTPSALAGSELFIDPNGWMRSEQSDNMTPAALAALVREICTYPLAAASGGHHHAE